MQQLEPTLTFNGVHVNLAEVSIEIYDNDTLTDFMNTIYNGPSFQRFFFHLNKGEKGLYGYVAKEVSVALT